MARANYQDRLARLRGEVGAMADTMLDRYETAIEVLSSGDPQRAREVIDGDRELNDWYLDIESECIDLLALEQPVAGDLRLVTSSFKIVTDIERMGDLATNLARYGRDAEPSVVSTADVTPLGEMAGEMVAGATDAYTRGDAEKARTVAARDTTLDERCKRTSEQIVRELVTGNASAAEPLDARLAAVSRALLTIRDIERVGDHAVNICARTVYLTENDDELIY